MRANRFLMRTPGGRVLLLLILAFVLLEAASAFSPWLEILLVNELGLITLRLRDALANPSLGEGAAAAATLVTYAFLHGGWIHLLFNSLLLAGLGLPVAYWLGPSRFLLLFAVTSIGGGLAHSALHWNELSVAVGASGVVFGMAAARAWLLSLGRDLTARERRAYLLRQAGSWMLINTLIWLGGSLYADMSGIGMEIAWASHAGGYAAGALLAPLLRPATSPADPRRRQDWN